VNNTPLAALEKIMNGAVQVWQFGDAKIPKHIARQAWRGGDEDWVIVAPAEREHEFQIVVNKMADCEANNVNPNQWVRHTYRGKKFLIYTCCHA
jgi:hypothetical protein